MSSPDYAFAIEPDARGADILRELGRGGPSRLQPESALQRSYLDTFDWRLFRAGFVLSEERRPGGGRTLRLESREGLPSRSMPAGRVSFARDLPEGWMRERIEPLAEGRRLLPRVRLEGRLYTLDLLDEEEKTVARATVEEGEACLPDGGSAALPCVVRVHSLQGYDEEARRVAEHLEAATGSPSLHATDLELALRALGAWPGTDPSQPQVMLLPGTRADLAARAVLSAYLAVFEANEPGVRADLDPEFLHDMRVACRRTRSFLGELDAVLDPAACERAREGFTWIGSKTGPLRDLDVLLARLREEQAEELEPFVLHVERRRKEALRALRQALDSERRRKLFEWWHTYLEEERPPREGDAQRSIEEVARERIASRLERFLERGRALSTKTSPGRIHKVRIQAKKLRYLVDAFGGLVARDDAPQAVRRLKKLQDALGAFNDREVEIEILGRFAAEMTAAGTASAATVLAMGRRQAELKREMKRLRKRFRRRFERLEKEPALEAMRGKNGEERA